MPCCAQIHSRAKVSQGVHIRERGSESLRYSWEARASQTRPTLWRRAGTAHIVAVLLVLSRLAFVLGGCRFRRYRLQSMPRIMQCTGIVAAVACLLVELFQLNARIAADPSPLINGDIAPFEWAGEAFGSRSRLCRPVPLHMVSG